jgi:hypothetical protein
VFRAPTGDFMNLVCFRNGSLAREWVRMEHRLEVGCRGGISKPRPATTAG